MASANPSANPLFHTLVVMGASVAFGCGGQVSSRDGDDDVLGTTNAGGAGGVANAGGSTWMSANGGWLSSGGSYGRGGSDLITLDPPHPVSVDHHCSPAQYNCDDKNPVCRRYYEMPTDQCPCDPTRPKTVVDCPLGTSFVCRGSTERVFTSDGSDPRVAFDCRCIPGVDGGNCSECITAYGGAGVDECNLTVGANGQRQMQCGCAWNFLQ